MVKKSCSRLWLWLKSVKKKLFNIFLFSSHFWKAKKTEFTLVIRCHQRKARSKKKPLHESYYSWCAISNGISWEKSLIWLKNDRFLQANSNFLTKLKKLLIGCISYHTKSIIAITNVVYKFGTVFQFKAL